MDIGVVHDLAVGVKPGGADAWTLAGVLARGVTRWRAAGHVQPAGPELDPAALASGPARRIRLCRLPRHAADRAAPRRRHPGGPHPGPVPALVDPGGRRPGRGHVRLLRPRGADRHPGAGGAARRGGRDRRGPGRVRTLGPGLPGRAGDLRHLHPLVRARRRRRRCRRNATAQQCLTSVNTHDLPPTAGYLAGEHVTLRESLGLLRRPVEEERAAATPQSRRRCWPWSGSAGCCRPRTAGRLTGVQATVEALYAFTALTPSSLLGVALVDAVGETRTQNQPGTSTSTRTGASRWPVPTARCSSTSWLPTRGSVPCWGPSGLRCTRRPEGGGADRPPSRGPWPARGPSRYHDPMGPIGTRSLAGGIALSLLLAGCTPPRPAPTQQAPSPAPTPSQPLPASRRRPLLPARRRQSPAQPPSSSASAQADSGGIQHIVIIVQENKPSSQIMGSGKAPYFNKLGDEYAVATNYRAIMHPSLPNYLALTSGTNAGITSNCNPKECRAEVRSIADEVSTSGRSWKMYAEGMPAPCVAQRTPGGTRYGTTRSCITPRSRRTRTPAPRMSCR